MHPSTSAARHRASLWYLGVAATGLFAVGASPAVAAPAPPGLEARIDALFAEHAGADRPGCVYSSVDDLARWERNFVTAEVGGREAIDRMLARPRFPSGEPGPYAYGLRHGSWRGLRTIARGRVAGFALSAIPDAYEIVRGVRFDRIVRAKD